MDYIVLLWVPVVTGFIGWLTNWVAIRMLFRPRRCFNLLGIKVQGVIPRRRGIIAAKVAEVVERELLSSHTLKHEFSKVDLKPHLKRVAEVLVREKLAEKLSSMPLIGGFINESMLSSLESMAVSAIEEQSGPIMAHLASEVESKIHVQRIIEDKINAFDLARLEGIIQETAQKEFTVIEWVGGILGFIIGVGQLVVLALMGNLNF